MQASAIEQQLEAELWHGVEQARELGYNPSYFAQMLSERGALSTVRKLINDAAPSDGFTKLWEMGRLDLAVEAVALRPPFSSLLTQAERLRARKRLAEYGFRS